MTDSSLIRFVECLMLEGIASLSQAPPGFAVESNIQALQGRFANRSLQVAMTVRRRSPGAGSLRQDLILADQLTAAQTRTTRADLPN